MRSELRPDLADGTEAPDLADGLEVRSRVGSSQQVKELLPLHSNPRTAKVKVVVRRRPPQVKVKARRAVWRSAELIASEDARMGLNVDLPILSPMGKVVRENPEIQLTPPPSPRPKLGTGAERPPS
jgi:hypothetical protein